MLFEEKHANRYFHYFDPRTTNSSTRPAGNVIARRACTQAMLLLRRPLHCRADRGLLIFSLIAAYVDLGTDAGAAVTFYRGCQALAAAVAAAAAAAVAVVFVVVFVVIVVVLSLLVVLLLLLVLFW